MEQPIISGIAFNRDEARLFIRGVPDTPGVAFKILGPISAANIEVDMIVQNVAHDNTTDFTFTVHRNDYNAAQSVLENTAREIGAREVVGDTNIAKVSIVGVGMRSHAGVASRMFESLAKENINILMISTSGRMLAQAVTGTPGHVNTMAEAVLHFIAKSAVRTCSPATPMSPMTRGKAPGTCVTSPWSRPASRAIGW